MEWCGIDLCRRITGDGRRFQILIQTQGSPCCACELVTGQKIAVWLLQYQEIRRSPILKPELFHFVAKDERSPVSCILMQIVQERLSG